MVPLHNGVRLNDASRCTPHPDCALPPLQSNICLIPRPACSSVCLRPASDPIEKRKAADVRVTSAAAGIHRRVVPVGDGRDLRRSRSEALRFAASPRT